MTVHRSKEVVNNRFPEQLVSNFRRKDTVLALVLISAQGQLKKYVGELICNMNYKTIRFNTAAGESKQNKSRIQVFNLKEGNCILTRQQVKRKKKHYRRS